MPIGITQMNNITMKNVTDIINITGSDPTEMIINANWMIYGGWFYFILLWVLGIILFKRAQDKEDQPLINAMYISAVLTALSFLLRVIYIVRNGIWMGLLTDYQLWIFPLISIFMAGIVYFTKE